MAKEKLAKVVLVVLLLGSVILSLGIKSMLLKQIEQNPDSKLKGVVEMAGNIAQGSSLRRMRTLKRGAFFLPFSILGIGSFLVYIKMIRD